MLDLRKSLQGKQERSVLRDPPSLPTKIAIGRKPVESKNTESETVEWEVSDVPVPSTSQHLSQSVITNLRDCLIDI